MTGKSHARSTNKIYTLTPLAAAVVAALSPTLPVLAQEEATRLDEIIVTATKREMNLQDVPHSIDVLSGLQLQKMGARDLAATLRALPSITLTALQPGQNSLVVRGISTGSYEYRTEAQVAVYIDEQPMTFNSQQVGIRNIDMARVENLPGPQGTLFGSSSQTGTLRYITNKPTTGSFLGQVEASYGNTSGGDDSYDLSAVLNIPMGDSFAIRVIGYTAHDGGYVDNVFGTSLSGNYDNAALVEDNFNEYEVSGGRLHALWNISDNWSALFTVIGENTEAFGVWDSDEALGDYKVTRFEDEIRTDDWVSTSITLSGDLGFADLSLTVSSFDRDIVYEYDNMTYSQRKDAYWGGGRYYELYYAGDPNYINYYNIALYNTDYYRSIVFNDQTQKRDSMELRLTSSGDNRLQWMVGAYYEDITDFWYYGTRLPGFENTTAFAAAQAYAYYYGYPNYYNNYTPNPNQAYPLPVTDVGYSDTLDRRVKQTAFFGEMSFDLTDDWTIHGGMRWSEYDRNVYTRHAFPEGLIAYPDSQQPFGDGSTRAINKIDDTIYKIGLRYNIDDDRMLYGLYSQGFRLGGTNSLRAARTGNVPFDYGGDYLDNYEFGIKSQWLDNRLTINADFFFMQWTDYQQSASFDQWWLTGIVNAGTAETQGIEIQTEWQATDNLLLSAKLFFADPKFKDDWCNDYVNGVYQGCAGAGTQVVAGMTMPGSPESTAYGSIYYTISNVLSGDLWFFYDITYSSETWNDIGHIRNQDTRGLSPSYTISSFSVGLQLANQLDIELNVSNLFDQSGYGYVWTGESGNAEYFDDSRFRRIRSQFRPRTFWLTLRKGFGGT